MLTRLFSITCVILFVTACSTSDRETRSIKRILTTRSNALNSRNITEYISVVSPHYSDKGKNLDQLKESLENNFRAFEQISYEPDIKSVTIKSDKAVAVSSYRMKVTVQGKEMTVNGTEHLILTKEPEGWKISAGI